MRGDDFRNYPVQTILPDQSRQHRHDEDAGHPGNTHHRREAVMRKMFTLLESDIDRLAYDLYNLTAQEIEMIEGNNHVG